jgi:hypothetical protein
LKYRFILLPHCGSRFSESQTIITRWAADHSIIQDPGRPAGDDPLDCFVEGPIVLNSSSSPAGSPSGQEPCRTSQPAWGITQFSSSRSSPSAQRAARGGIDESLAPVHRATVQQILMAVMNDGKGDLDHSAIVTFIEDMAGIEVKKQPRLARNRPARDRSVF